VIWNPFVRTPTGRPVGPVVPPELRVLGGVATAEQRLMAQQAFYRFCEGRRGSVVPNAIAAGQLPDGSRYRIVVVGIVTIMELWPAGGEDDRLSGIGLRLTSLTGGLVPGHVHSDGTRPQPYILTPRVVSGTRKTTGKWRVRKVDGYSGGKAVWGDKAGKRFFAGVDGKEYDIDILDWSSIDEIFGTNNRAYRVGEYAAGDLIYTGGNKAAGAFRARVDAVPFTHRDSEGRLWIMQITPAEFPAQRLQLWGQLYDGAEFTYTIGDLLGDVAVPAGYSMVWQTISVAPDGLRARIVFRKVAGVEFAHVDLAIAPGGISIASMVDTGSYTPATSNTVNTGNQFEGEFTSTTVTTPAWNYLAGGYGYDAKGNTTAFKLRQRALGSELNSRLVEFRVREGEILSEDLYLLRTLSRQVTSRETFAATSIDYGSRVVSFDGGGENLDSTFDEVDESWYDLSVPGGVRRRVRRAGVATTVRRDELPRVVFVDELTDLNITSRYIHTGTNVLTTDYTFNSPPGGAEGTVDNSTSITTHTYARRLTVACRGVEVLVVDTPLDSNTNWTRIQYAALSATDPLTGALCVNVVELDYQAGASAPPLRSWIVLADDKGAKQLRDVLELPDGTDVRVEKDFSLLSVP